MTDSAFRSIVARLVHDVGKYITRGARNLPLDSAPEAIVQMIEHDLYGRDGGDRASDVFVRLSSGLPFDVQLSRVRGLLAEIDQLEPGVRARDGAAVRRAAELALAVEQDLRSLAASPAIFGGEP